MVPFSLIKTAGCSDKAESLAFAMRHVDLGWAAGIVCGRDSLVALTAVLLVLQLGRQGFFFRCQETALCQRCFPCASQIQEPPYINTIIIGIVLRYSPLCEY